MAIKGELQRRLREVQKRAGTGRGERKLRVWFVYGHDEKEEKAEIEKIKRGEVPHKDGGPYSEKDANFFIDVRYCPKEETVRFDYWGSGAMKDREIKPEPEPARDPEAELRREIEELEARKAELMAKRKSHGAYKKGGGK